MKAIHNCLCPRLLYEPVVLYPKDTEKWKQFTTTNQTVADTYLLFCIPKILKNESNSQLEKAMMLATLSCFVSQRYWKMKAIHNNNGFMVFCIVVVLYPKDTEKWKQFTTIRFLVLWLSTVVLYPKDTEKWKQFTTGRTFASKRFLLFCIPKILKNESNSQLNLQEPISETGCFVSQRYWKMKAIHNESAGVEKIKEVVLYPKDTEKWKQFTTI